MLSARDQGALDAVAAEVRKAAPVTVSTVAADLAGRDDVAGVVERAEAVGGPVDVLVNNAGVEETRRFDQRTPDDIATMTDVNLVAPMLLTRAVLPGMRERGRGHIVNIASIAGLLASAYEEPTCAPNSASRHRDSCGRYPPSGWAQRWQRRSSETFPRSC